LLRRYLLARGLPDHLGWEVRDAYWLAAASNVLSGALRYHLAVMDGWGQPSAAGRAQSSRAIKDCLRVIRRADAYWRSGPRARGVVERVDVGGRAAVIHSPGMRAGRVASNPNVTEGGSLRHNLV
jgi:hypothetical protein